MLPAWSKRGLHVICKPIGPLCNLRCRYCFYLEKSKLYPDERNWRMSGDTLAEFVRQYIEAQPPTVTEMDFAFQGGEPTLMGLDFFRQLIELQKQCARPGLVIHNSLQTNGTLLDDEWCQFLAHHNFLVGLSLDGPPQFHDRFRFDAHNRGTFAQVERALHLLKKHRVRFNVLCCVNRINADYPQEIFQYFQAQGVKYLQFIPIVVPRDDAVLPADSRPEQLVSDESVLPHQWGRFLTRIFDLWLAGHVHDVYIREIQQAIAAFSGRPAELCVFAPECGRALVIEHNGDIYSCDHFVDDQHRLGNIHHQPIRELAELEKQKQFGRSKATELPQYCRQCSVRFVCNGGCPKDRIVPIPGEQYRLNFLCEGYRSFFLHVQANLQRVNMQLALAESHTGSQPPVKRGAKSQSPAGTVQGDRQSRPSRSQKRSKQQDRSSGDAPLYQKIGRNAPCPCGSGKKYKNCCMRRGGW